MTSEFERQAAREAVDAVERRWQRDADIRHKQQLRKRVTSILAVLFLLVAAAAAGWGYVQWRKGVRMQDLLQRGESLFRSDANDIDSGMSEYMEIVNELLSAPVKLSKEMPEELKPKKAASGQQYVALSRDRKGVLSVFRMTADGHGKTDMQKLSLGRPPQKVSYAEFKAARDGCPYLVVVGKIAYLYGSTKLADAEKLRTAVRDLAK